MARLTLDLPQDLISELEKRAAKNGQSTQDFIREDLEFRCLHRLPARKRGDVSDRPEFQEAIRIQDETQKMLEGSGLIGPEFIRRVRDGASK
ncbi:MAG: ribbon-helix-helix protein, CopG family [Rubrobacteraceae bacterium]